LVIETMGPKGHLATPMFQKNRRGWEGEQIFWQTSKAWLVADFTFL
jgi:hypothetical protein